MLDTKRNMPFNESIDYSTHATLFINTKFPVSSSPIRIQILHKLVKRSLLFQFQSLEIQSMSCSSILDRIVNVLLHVSSKDVVGQETERDPAHARLMEDFYSVDNLVRWNHKIDS